MTSWDCFSPFVRRLKLSCLILLHNQLDAGRLLTMLWRWLGPVTQCWHSNVSAVYGGLECSLAFLRGGPIAKMSWAKVAMLRVNCRGERRCANKPANGQRCAVKSCIVLLNTYVTVVGTLRKQVNIGQCTPAPWQEFWLIICRGHTHRPPGANLVLPASWLETQWYGGFHQWGYPKMNCL